MRIWQNYVTYSVVLRCRLQTFTCETSHGAWPSSDWKRSCKTQCCPLRSSWFFLSRPRFNQDLRFVSLPDGLEEIQFGENFHPASWKDIALPSSLTNLKFGKRFIQNLEDASLPENLQSLSFASLGYAFEQSLRRAHLPSHIQRLQTGSILVSA